MADKTVSKHLTNIEKQFANNDPVLQKAVKVFQELDDLEFELGLIENEETTARRVTWWPVISTLGGYSSAKSDFINRYFGMGANNSLHKFTVFHFTPQPNSTTLPGNALDADHRFPFYQVSRDIENITAGEGSKINSYLELITANSPKLRQKMVINTPVLSPGSETEITAHLRQHVINISDLVLVFTDLFEADPVLMSQSVKDIVAQQDSNKFVFVIDHSEIAIDSIKATDIITAWQRRLSEIGIRTGQFILLSQGSDLSLIDRRVNNLSNARSYRVLASLEKGIRDVDDVIFSEVESSIMVWKERSNASTLIILGFLVMLMLFAEIAMGILDLLLDPIIGPAIILTLVILLTPVHIIISKIQAKFIIKQLHKRQKKLNIPEDLAGLFEKSLSFWRIILPLTSPFGKNKKNRKKINAMIENTKDLIENLNDQYNVNQSPELYRATAEFATSDEIIV